MMVGVANKLCLTNGMHLKNYVKTEKFSILREVVISIIVSALVTTAFSYYSNEKIDNRIAARQFIYEFGRVFLDNPKYRDVSTALEEQYLYNKNFLKKNGDKFSDYELDDYLYLIDDIWGFYKEGFISKELLDEQYSYFFCITSNSSEIKKYREKLSDEGFSDAHDYLDDISSELNLKGKDCRDL